MMRKKSVIGAIALLALTVMVGAGAISAAAGDDRRDQGANGLVGSWEVSVDRGPQLPPVKSLHTYTRGHALVETANLPNRSPSQGAWEHVKGRLYATTHIFFRFDPTGAYLGTQKINETVRLAQNGESFTAVAISTLFDPNGNVVVSGLRATIAGQRIHVERIPDQP